MPYGIIRYVPFSGGVPEEDEANFDGWYSDEEDAFMVFSDWEKRYQHCIVAIVQDVQVRWTK